MLRGLSSESRPRARQTSPRAGLREFNGPGRESLRNVRKPPAKYWNLVLRTKNPKISHSVELGTLNTAEENGKAAGDVEEFQSMGPDEKISRT